MEKKKILVKLSIVAAICIVIALGADISVYKWNEYCRLSEIIDVKTEEIKYTYEESIQNSMEDLEMVEAQNGRICVVYSDSEEANYGIHEAIKICPNSYFLFSDIISETTLINEKDGYSDRELHDYSKFQIKLYDVDTREYVKSIDVKKIIQSYPNYDACSYFEVVNQDNKAKIRISLYPKDARAYDLDNWIYLIIDPDGTEIKVSDEMLEFWSSEDESEEVIAAVSPWTHMSDTEVDKEAYDELYSYVNEMSNQEDYEGLSDQAYDYVMETKIAREAWDGWNDPEDTYPKYFLITPFHNWPGMISVGISTNQLPKNSEKLYTMFPELKSYEGKPGYITTLILPKEDVAEIFAIPE